MIRLEELYSRNLEWLFDSSFLGNLDESGQRAVLGGAEFRTLDEGHVLIEQGAAGSGVDLVVSGQATVTHRDPTGTEELRARVGPGSVLGERALRRKELTGARVVAATKMQTLHLPAGHFQRCLAEQPALAGYVDDLIDLRDRSPLLLSLLLRDPILRGLGRDGLERLLQSGRLERWGRGERIVRACSKGTEVYLLVKGRVTVHAPAPEGGREQVASNGPGWFFGHAAALLEVPRTADVEAAEACELLVVEVRAFMELVQRNPPLHRRLYQSLAGLDIRAHEAMDRSKVPMAIAVWSPSRAIGARTLAYGVAGSLAAERPVTVVDPDGPASAQRLGREIRAGRVGSVPIRRMTVPEAWGAIEVMWPKEPDQLAELVEALKGRAGPRMAVVVALDAGQPPDEDTLQAVETTVFLRWAHDSSAAAPLGRHGFRVDAVRLEPNIDLPMAASRNAVRIPDDPETGPRFWGSGDLAGLLDMRRPFGRAVARLVRVLTGRTVGVALGGGGALGFAHIGLLRALHEAEIPVDYLAGVSFGSVVGAAYAAGGLELCDELIRRRRAVRYLALGAMATLRPFRVWLDRLTDGQPLGSTEIPYFPVAYDLATRSELVITRGTVADGMEASSSFPGLFPTLKRGVHRIVDGGIINNVPASVVWDAGANFIIASNIVPPNPISRSPGGSIPGVGRIRDRADDLLTSIYTLLSQTGRDRATLADHVFDLKIEGMALNDFDAAQAIYERGLEQARDEIQTIIEARRSDRSSHLGQR